MLPPLLNTLGFRCNNTAYRPVMDAMKLLKKYDAAPMDGLCVLVALRDAVRRREIYVEGDALHRLPVR
jgi:hypothetical protein